MRASASILPLAEVAVKAKYLKRERRVVITAKPHVKKPAVLPPAASILACNFPPMLRAVVVYVIEGKKHGISFPATSAARAAITRKHFGAQLSKIPAMRAPSVLLSSFGVGSAPFRLVFANRFTSRSVQCPTGREPFFSAVVKSLYHSYTRIDA